MVRRTTVSPRQSYESGTVSDDFVDYYKQAAGLLKYRAVPILEEIRDMDNLLKSTYRAEFEAALGGDPDMEKIEDIFDTLESQGTISASD